MNYCISIQVNVGHALSKFKFLFGKVILKTNSEKENKESYYIA